MTMQPHSLAYDQRKLLQDQKPLAPDHFPPLHLGVCDKRSKFRGREEPGGPRFVCFRSKDEDETTVAEAQVRHPKCQSHQPWRPRFCAPR